MVDIVLNFKVSFEIAGKSESLNICISVIKDLKEPDFTIDDYINNYIEEYLVDNYCSCSFNEGQNYCDCGCAEWDSEYKIAGIDSKYGAEL